MENAVKAWVCFDENIALEKAKIQIHFLIRDKETILKLWQKLMPEIILGRNKLDLNKLTKMIDGFTGGDIRNVILTASSIAI